MLFVSGAPNLVDFTRFMARDPAGAPNPLFTTLEVKAVVNLTYLQLREKMGAKDVGHGNKRTYADSIADQMYYAKPSDLERPISVELEDLGKNLATSAQADVNPIFLMPKESKEALQAFETGKLAGATYVFLHDTHFGIVNPPTAAQAGTLAIRMLYQATSAELSADGDEPTIAKPHHPLICYRSAAVLLAAKGLDLGDLPALIKDTEGPFLRSLSDNFESLSEVIPAAGLRSSRGIRTKVGSIARTN